MHKIKVNPMATEDLIEIKDYIKKELDNPTAAINVINKVIDKYELTRGQGPVWSLWLEVKKHIIKPPEGMDIFQAFRRFFFSQQYLTEQFHIITVIFNHSVSSRFSIYFLCPIVMRIDFIHFIFPSAFNNSTGGF